MKKVKLIIQIGIATDYLHGKKYKDIMSKYQINRWDIQNALSKFNIKTNRIKSHSRLPKFIMPVVRVSKEEVRKMFPKQGYHDIDFLPPMKVNKNNPVLDDDLDYMERVDAIDDTDDQVEGTYEMVIGDDGKVRYKRND